MSDTPIWSSIAGVCCSKFLIYFNTWLCIDRGQNPFIAKIYRTVNFLIRQPGRYQVKNQRQITYDTFKIKEERSKETKSSTPFSIGYHSEKCTRVYPLEEAYFSTAILNMNLSGFSFPRLTMSLKYFGAIILDSDGFEKFQTMTCTIHTILHLRTPFKNSQQY